MLEQTMENFAIFSFFFFLYFFIRFAWEQFSSGFFNHDLPWRNSAEVKKNGYKTLRWKAHTGEIDHKSKRWNSVEEANSYHGLAK